MHKTITLKRHSEAISYVCVRCAFVCVVVSKLLFASHAAMLCVMCALSFFFSMPNNFHYSAYTEALRKADDASSR